MRMAVFSFGIDKPTKDIGGKELFHRVQVVTEDGGFKHRIDQALVLLTAFQKFLGIFDVAPESWDRSCDMLAMLQAEDGVLGVSRGVGCAVNGFDRIVFDHLFQRWVRHFAFCLLGHIGTAVRKQVADCDQLNIGMILEIKCQAEFADPMANDSEPNLAVAMGRPCFRSIIVGLCLIEAG